MNKSFLLNKLKGAIRIHAQVGIPVGQMEMGLMFVKVKYLTYHQVCLVCLTVISAKLI